MFGIYRFFLACMVVVTHIAPSVSNWSGPYAVFSFYIISGYLMSLVLTRMYGFSLVGIMRFLVNRFLRIYPVYYMVLFLAIVVINRLPQHAQAINTALRMPSTGLEWVHNLAIFGLMYDTGRLIPPAWSLYVELVYYIAMALLLVRERKIVLIWFWVSLLYTTYLIGSGVSFSDRYYPPFAASLPFSIGAIIFFYRDRFPLNSTRHFWIASILYIANLFFARHLWGLPDEYSMRYSAGFYLQVLFAGYVTVVLSSASANSSWLRGADRLFGDLAYPVFLCHYHIATVVYWMERGVTGRVLLFRSSIFILLTAFLIHYGVERIINKLRDRVRHGSSGNSSIVKVSALEG